MADETKRVKVRWTAEYEQVIEVPLSADETDIQDCACDIDPESPEVGSYVANSFNLIRVVPQ